ncbi:PAS domain S-box protein [Sphingomonas sp. 8AM]|uniref:PAS domain S-box protein n=1 Tax=Sphingomonas sp. 8AM TaxID=2653170 RepID=UPI0013595DDB|nr:PAS domain S-box protein [Sphingomonas sp. 8AM]
MAQLMDGVILLDPTGVILGANPAALAMHGVEKVEELGGTAEGYARRFTLWTSEHRALPHRDYPIFKVLAGESIPDMVVEVAPAGEEEARWVHQVRDVSMDVDGGEPDYLAVVLSDVSGRYDAQARFDAMFRANPAPAIIVRHHDMKLVAANAGFLALTDFRQDDLLGRSLFGLDLIGGLPDRSRVQRQIEDGAVVPQTEAELLVADGTRRLVLFAGQPIDVTQEDALLLTFADLQPRREAQQSLATSERHLRAVFEMAPVAMAIVRVSDQRLKSVNAAFCELTGYDAGALVDRTAREAGWWHDPDQQGLLDARSEEEGAIRDRDLRIVTRAGMTVDCLASAETIRLQGHACVLWVFQDVTERRRSDAELGAAIDEALKDANWLSRSILDRLAALRRPAPHVAPVELSPREREVLDLVCDDLDDAAIAERLAISRNTVRNHVASIYAKIGTNRRSGAVVWGCERGMGSTRN